MEKTEKKQEIKETKLLSLKEKIILIANEIRITKEGENTYSNYDYFTPDSINKILNPLLLKYGVFSHFVLIKEETTYRGCYTLENFENEDKRIYGMESPEISIKATNPVQSLGGLQTYLKRYLQMNAFNISDNRDDFDSNEMKDKKNSIEKKETKFQDELKDIIRQKGGTTVAKAKELLNELTGAETFPTDEKQCSILINQILLKNGKDGNN